MISVNEYEKVAVRVSFFIVDYISTPLCSLNKGLCLCLCFSPHLFLHSTPRLLPPSLPSQPVTSTLYVSAILGTIQAAQYGYCAGAYNAPQAIIAADLNIDKDGPVWAWGIMATFCIGGFVGANMAGGLANYLGRKQLIVMLNFPFLIAGGLVLAAGALKGDSGLYALIASRVIQGLGAGAASVVTPMYLGEIATPETKGAFGALNQFTLVILILVAQLLGLVMSTSARWGALLAVTGVLAILGLLSAPFMVESPRWLHSQRRPDEARKAVTALRQCTEAEANEEIGEWEDASGSASDGGVMGMGDVLNRADLRFPLFLAIMLQLTQQFSGINA